MAAGDAYLLRRRLRELEGEGEQQGVVEAADEGGALCPVRVIRWGAVWCLFCVVEREGGRGEGGRERVSCLPCVLGVRFVTVVHAHTH